MYACLFILLPRMVNADEYRYVALTLDGEFALGVDSTQLVDCLTPIRARVGDAAVGESQRGYVVVVRQTISLALIQFLAVLVPVRRRRRLAGVDLALQCRLLPGLRRPVRQRLQHLRSRSTWTPTHS